MLASPWMALVVILAVLMLLYRQQILSFGTRYGGWWDVLLFSIVSAPLLLLGWSTVSSHMLGVALLALMSEIEVAHQGKQRHPTYTFNLGILLSLLTKIHPAFIWLLLPGLQLMHQQDRLSWRHLSALLFGLLSLWWLGALIFASPDLEAILIYLERGVEPLWQGAPPFIEYRYWIIGLGVALLWASVELSMSYKSITVRNRQVLSNLLLLSWTLGILFAVYRQWMFGIGSFFYLAMQAQFFLKGGGIHRKKSRVGYVVTLLYALALMGLQLYVGLPH